MTTRSAALAVVVAAATASGAAHAGGLFIPGAGPQAQARAGAFVARADDGTAINHNPAGLAKQKGLQIHLGANLINLSLEFARDGVYEPTGAEPPHAYEGMQYPVVKDEAEPILGFAGFQAVPVVTVSWDTGGKIPLAIAAGLYAPLAFPNREYPESYDLGDPADPAPGPQRYDTMIQKAETALPSVAVAYRVLDQLDIGARFSFGFSKLKATTAVWGFRNYEEYIEKDGIFTVDVSDNFVPSFGVGALFRPSPAVEIGVAYNSSMTLDAAGHGISILGSEIGLPGMPEVIVPPPDDVAQCKPGGTIDALSACVTLHLPQTASIGARWILRDGDAERADVELDVKWEDWSAASDTLVVVDGESSTVPGRYLTPQTIKHGFKDVISVRLGGSYTLPIDANKLMLRGGVAYDTETAPANWQRVDQDGAARTTIGLGAAWEMSRFRIDLGGGYVIEGDRTVPTCNPSSPDNIGCDGTNMQTPVADREQPDPAQPLVDPSVAVQSPFNGGTISSSYVIFSLGVTTWF